MSKKFPFFFYQFHVNLREFILNNVISRKKTLDFPKFTSFHVNSRKFTQINVKMLENCPHCKSIGQMLFICLMEIPIQYLRHYKSFIKIQNKNRYDYFR